MTLTTKNLIIDRDIFKKQQDTITELRDQLEQRDRHIEYLERRTNEYDELLNIAATNQTTPAMCPNPQCGIQMQVPISFMQILNIRQSRINATVQAERDRINYERQSKRELEDAERHDREVAEVLRLNPSLQEYANERKAKIQQSKNAAQKLATDFYELPEDLARKYFWVPHQPEDSAVKHLLITTTDEKGKLQAYECEYCADTCYNLDEFERHCYLQKAEHRDATLRAIEDDALQAINKINRELSDDIESGIQSLHNKKIKEQHDKELEEQEQLRKSLPYAGAGTTT